MPARLPYPEFASEADEADWLYEHRDQLDLYFSESNASLHELLLDQDLILPEAVMAVPLSSEDFARASKVAAAEGVAPEEYIGRVVHNALQTRKAA
jgi:predicted DNA binding CopG/RHH family protein